MDLKYKKARTPEGSSQGKGQGQGQGRGGPTPPLGKDQEKVLLRRDLEKKRNLLQKKLDMIRDYKQLLAADGMKPDAADKAKESLIIQQLLGLQKDQARLDKPLAPRPGGPKRPPVGSAKPAKSRF